MKFITATIKAIIEKKCVENILSHNIVFLNKGLTFKN